MNIIETERLILREMTEDDAENAYLLNLDPDVVKFTGDVSFKSIDEARLFLQNYDHYKKYSYGRWAVIRKSDNKYLGWCGLKYLEETGEIDIGYRFMTKYWNQGYATESARACLEYGFNQLNIKTIIGRAMKENIASIKVFEKIGMKYYRDSKCGDEMGVIYKIERENK